LVLRLLSLPDFLLSGRSPCMICTASLALKPNVKAYSTQCIALDRNTCSSTETIRPARLVLPSCSQFTSSGQLPGWNPARSTSPVSPGQMSPSPVDYTEEKAGTKLAVNINVNKPRLHSPLNRLSDSVSKLIYNGMNQFQSGYRQVDIMRSSIRLILVRKRLGGLHLG
jgi:hypothetical protein